MGEQEQRRHCLGPPTAVLLGNMVHGMPVQDRRSEPGCPRAESLLSVHRLLGRAAT